MRAMAELSRRTREKRAYNLVVAGGALGAIGAIGFLLAIFGVVGFGWPIILLIIAAVCGLVFRSTVS